MDNRLLCLYSIPRPHGKELTTAARAVDWSDNLLDMPNSVPASDTESISAPALKIIKSKIDVPIILIRKYLLLRIILVFT
jgi:hypothetical protein